LKMAYDLGIPAEVISTQTPDELDELVYDLNRQALEKPKPAPQETQDEEVKLEGVDESQWDPELIKVLKGQAKKQKDLEKKLADSEKRDQQRERHSQNAKIDNLFSGLGADYEATFGKGGVEAIGQGSIELKRRLAVLDAMGREKGSFE